MSKAYVSGDAKVTLKVDKHGRLCAWLGNVQSSLVYDRNRQLVAIGESALCRLEGANKELAMSKIPKQFASLLEQGFSVVLTRKEAFL